MKLKLTLLFTASLFWCCNAFAIEKDNLFIFIGEKVSVEEFTPPPPPGTTEDTYILMDGAFKAKYNIIKSFHGSTDRAEFEFEAYDHYGYPKFANFKNALLFVTKYEDKLYHVKYQYFDVYKTSDERWAYCGKSYGYEDEFEEEYPEKIQSKDIDFIEPIFHDISELKEELKDYPEDKEFLEEEIEFLYPNKYFDTSGNKAICRGKGIYAEDLARAHAKYILKHWN